MDPQQLTDDLRDLFRGRLHFDRLTRGLYATDASPFHIEPGGVAVPEDEESVAALVRYCHEHAIPVTARGAGTGLSGESLNGGLAVDFSVHFRRIVHVGPDTVTVQPGVVLHQLNVELAKVGRRFAPDPASAATCTAGGMVATNASGGNAFRHGYTRDHVAALRVVWDTGEVGEPTPGKPTPPAPLPAGRGEIRSVESERELGTRTAPSAFSPLPAGRGAGGVGPRDAPEVALANREVGSRTADIARSVEQLLRANAERIALTRVRTPFDRCGYQLHGVLTDAGPDLTRLLVGSEGTLGIVTEATLRTVPLAGGTCHALVGFPTLDAAVRAALALRRFGPTACDLLDRRLLALTRGAGLPAVGAALLVVFEADTERAATERTWGAVEALRRAHILRVLAEPTCTPDGVAHVRGIRDAAVSGLYAANGPRPVPFVEDVGVPPDALPEFLTKVQDVLKQFEVTGTFLAHALTGQVHTRPLLDLNADPDRAKLWPLAEAVHALALALGGTVSTQHGTGLTRTPWVERQFGPLVPVFRELKRIFDPKGILNPGKIVGPDPSREAWPLRPRIRDSGFRVQPEENPEDGSPPPAPRSPLLVWPAPPEAEVARCNGCGDCRTRTAPQRMCPAFRAKGDEISSPRGLVNMLRVLTDPELATPDEVREAAEACINCKQCRDECDARVNVPKLMLEAKARRHAEHGLERGDWALARAEGLAILGSNFAPLANALLARRPVRWVLEKWLGLSRSRRLPAFHLRNFFRRARGLGLTKKRGARNPEPGTAPPAGRVALFADVFAAYTDPLVGLAAVRVLQHHGVEVYVPPRQVGSGAGPLARGDLDAARAHAVRNVRALTDLTREGFRIVCLEPTAALMLTQDYLDILDDPDAAALAAHTTDITAYLGELHAARKLKTDFRPLDVALGHHVPCHMKALRGKVHGPDLLRLIPGATVYTLDAGCSGMAGTWGLKADNVAASLAMGASMLAAFDRPRVLFGSTECGGCRMQMQQGTGKRALHPVQYLAYAYGLLPELDERLSRPLGALVSD